MDQIVFFDGKFIKEQDAKISIKTHALHYGTGCFGGMRAYYNSEKDALFIWRIEDHLRRFLNSCKILFIDLPFSVPELKKMTIELVEKNFEKTDLYIRPLAYKSDPAIGNFNLSTLKNGFLMYTTALGRYLDVEKGIKANISSWRRISDNAIPPRGKITGAYVNTALAKTESLQNGYEEALFLDHNGHIVEGSAENLFMVRNGAVITPPLSDDILQGITRDTIIRLCKNDFNVEVIERSIDRSEIYCADEVFLVGTGAEVSPVIEIDKRPIGNGSIGNITKKVKDMYFALVRGQLTVYKEFSTKISAPQ